MSGELLIKAFYIFKASLIFFIYIYVNSSFKKCKSKSMSIVADKQTISNDNNVLRE